MYNLSSKHLFLALHANWSFTPAPQACCLHVSMHVQVNTLYPVSTIRWEVLGGGSEHIPSYLHVCWQCPLIKLLTPGLSPLKGLRAQKKKGNNSPGSCKSPYWKELTTAGQVECPVGTVRAWGPGISPGGSSPALHNASFIWGAALCELAIVFFRSRSVAEATWGQQESEATEDDKARAPLPSTLSLAPAFPGRGLGPEMQLQDTLTLHA